MTTDIIDRAIDLAAAGSPDQARELLRSVILEDQLRDQALFALAYCFEKESNLATAIYLYGCIHENYPDLEVSKKRLKECKAQAEEQRLSEDFEDSGHVRCEHDGLRHRAEYSVCPYCGLSPGETRVEVLDDEPESEEEPIAPERTTAPERLRDWARSEDAPHVVRDFAEKESVERFAQKAGDLSRHASKRIEEIAASDRAQNIAEQTRELGDELSDRVNQVLEREDVQETRGKFESWSQNKASRLETWLQSDAVKKKSKVIGDAIEGFLAKIQESIDRAKGNVPEEDEPEETDPEQPQ